MPHSVVCKWKYHLNAVNDNDDDDYSDYDDSKANRFFLGGRQCTSDRVIKLNSRISIGPDTNSKRYMLSNIGLCQSFSNLIRIHLEHVATIARIHTAHTHIYGNWNDRLKNVNIRRMSVSTPLSAPSPWSILKLISETNAGIVCVIETSIGQLRVAVVHTGYLPWLLSAESWMCNHMRWNPRFLTNKIEF